jgi:hypothetical protein
MVKPIDPSQRRTFDRVQHLPPIASSNYLGLIRPDHRFAEPIVVGIALAADRGDDAGVINRSGVPRRRILQRRSLS